MMLCYDVRTQIFSPNIMYNIWSDWQGEERRWVLLCNLQTPILVHQRKYLLKTQLARLAIKRREGKCEGESRYGVVKVLL